MFYGHYYTPFFKEASPVTHESGNSVTILFQVKSLRGFTRFKHSSLTGHPTCDRVARGLYYLSNSADRMPLACHQSGFFQELSCRCGTLKHTPDTMNLCLANYANESIARDSNASGLPALSAQRPPLSLTLSLAPHLHALPHHHPASRKP